MINDPRASGGGDLVGIGGDDVIAVEDDTPSGNGR